MIISHSRHVCRDFKLLPPIRRRVSQHTTHPMPSLLHMHIPPRPHPSPYTCTYPPQQERVHQANCIRAMSPYHLVVGFQGLDVTHTIPYRNKVRNTWTLKWNVENTFGHQLHSSRPNTWRANCVLGTLLPALHITMRYRFY